MPDDKYEDYSKEELVERIQKLEDQAIFFEPQREIIVSNPSDETLGTVSDIAHLESSSGDHYKFEVIEMDDFISRETITETKAVLADPERIRKMVDHNYALAMKYFSYSVLETKLWYLVKSFFGE